MKRRAVIEKAIGETRAAVYEGRRLVELHLERDSQKHLPQTGDEYRARVRSLEPSLNGVFLDLGRGLSGFLAFTNNSAMPRLVEGQSVDVVVTKPAKEDKQATVRFLKTFSLGDSPSVIFKNTLENRLETRFPGISLDHASVSVIDDAVERRISLKGGGTITLDQTQALLAIDVDKGPAPKTLDVCLAATDMIASQLRLRGLGGLVVIDFPNLRSTKQRNQLFKAVERAFENDKAIVKVAPLSRFGCIELTRSLDYPSLDSLINTRFGEPTIETQSLRALRQLEREALANRGAQFTLYVSTDIKAWLDETDINWKEALQDRIGPRYTLTAHAKNGYSVQADR